MNLKSLLILTVIVALAADHSTAQVGQRSGQIRYGDAQVRTVAAEVPAVSQDLLQIYENTKLAKTDESVSQIVDACRRVLSSRGRSKLDRDYALSLLAWALNRRGEIRSDMAAEFVESGEPSAAERLDAEAIADFESAVKYAPNNWRTHHNFAISLAMQGEYQQAIDELTLAIQLKPDYANAHFNRGELYFEIGDYQNALTDYSQAIELNSKDAQYFNSRGHSRFLLEEYSSAVGDYQKAVELEADNAAFQTDLADAYQYLGQWKNAAQAYQSAVAADNRFARAYQNVAWLMATCPEESLRNPALALAAAKKAIQLSERTPRGLDTLAAATALSGNHAEAAQLQAEAVAMSGDVREKQEFQQRLTTYRSGSLYLQPKPLVGMAATQVDRQPIRAAAGQSSKRR